MSIFVPKVAPRSRASIDADATCIIQALSPSTMQGKQPFPVHHFLESGLLETHFKVGFAVRSDLPEGVEGQLLNGEDGMISMLALASDTYDDLVAGNARSRFTAAHEIGHAILHSQQIALANATAQMARRKAPLYRRDQIKPYEDPEWQADAFAAALLMPTSAVDALGNCPHRLVSALGVSLAAASNRTRRRT